MTVEELMMPRYKVIADWPDAARQKSLVGNIYKWIKGFHNPEQEQWCEHYNRYPHLFKKLEWWKERKVEDMPEYLIEPHAITKLPVVCKAEWKLENGTTYCKPEFNNLGWIDVRHFSKYIKPASLKEYNEYQLTNKIKTK